jgi:N-dimethylarginine dimethylaminohydrolase
MFAKTTISGSDSNKILLCSPQYFEVIDEKNAHMKDFVGKTDTTKAISQWESLLMAYKTIAEQGDIAEVSVLNGVKGLEDMVFAANQTFPFVDENGNKKVLMSNMKHPNRQKEVEFYQTFFENKGYEILHLQKELLFEGMGDLLPIPLTRKALCGHGFRTSVSTIETLTQLTGLEIIGLELINPNFYHLDTCIVPVDKDTILYTPSAFSAQGNAKLKTLFAKLIEVPIEEAMHGFALNMHIVNGSTKKWAVIQKGNVVTEQLLKKLNIEVITVDTSEYIKSGGSVFCLKMMYY